MFNCRWPPFRSCGKLSAPSRPCPQPYAHIRRHKRSLHRLLKWVQVLKGLSAVVKAVFTHSLGSKIGKSLGDQTGEGESRLGYTCGVEMCETGEASPAPRHMGYGPGIHPPPPPCRGRIPFFWLGSGELRRSKSFVAPQRTLCSRAASRSLRTFTRMASPRPFPSVS